MENFKINVVDGIMGSGKSSAIINLIKMHKHDYPESHFLIIVPYFFFRIQQNVIARALIFCPRVFLIFPIL